jgi:ubiquinone/menaquinone biosynthesis C-methylase UbiE
MPGPPRRAAARSLLPALDERSTEAELLDGELPAAAVRASLADLRLVNRWLAGRRGLRRAVAGLMPRGGRLLDVGCGSGDVAGYLGTRLGSDVLCVGVDQKLLHLREAPPAVACVAADAGRLPFLDRSFDVVTASLFLHHFDAARLAGLLRELGRVAQRAVVVSDLERARVPLLFGRLVFPLLFRTPVSVHDGLVSIRRGFRPHELEAAFSAAGLRDVAVRRLFPYRLLAVASLA